jgi:hypothetical protein
MTAMRSAGVSVMMSVLAASVAAALPVPDKLSAHPKFIYRQIGGGYTLAMEKDRQPKTFFVCGPTKTDCISTKEVGWRKPFIILRSGAVLRRSYDIIDTTGAKHSESPKYLASVPRYPAAIAWNKLSATRPIW